MLGFSVVTTPMNLFYCFIGVLIGTLVGVLPGIGTAGSVAVLLPFTFGLPPATAIILLAGIWYGAMYGGSTTSILVNIPGESSSVVTCLDGYQMARQGRAGRALGISAIGSFIAGTLSVCLLMLVAPVVARYAVKIGPPELFALILFGLTLSAYLSSGPVIKSFMMVALGMILGTQGIDTVSGVQRFTFNMNEFYEGVGILPVIMGIYGIGEILINLEETIKRDVFKVSIKGLLPDWNDWKASFGPIMRGTFLGFFLGILPASGTLISTFVSYIMEKRLSKHPERFGKGAIEGVAGPEAANNAASSGTFVPLLDVRDSHHRNHGAHSGGAPDPWDHPGPSAHTESPRCVLGGHCEHVHREYHASGPEPSFDRNLGPSAESTLQHPFPLNPRFLCDRRLFQSKQFAGCHFDDLLRCLRIPCAENRVRVRPSGLCLHPVTDLGRSVPAVAPHVPGGFDAFFSRAPFRRFSSF